jgi:hypothetical protein
VGADRAWTFTFVAGPFDGYRLDPVPPDEVDPGEDPPPELLVWEDDRMHVYTPDQIDCAPSAERYTLLDADLPALTAVYEWGELVESGAGSMTMAAAA